MLYASAIATSINPTPTKRAGIKITGSDRRETDKMTPAARNNKSGLCRIMAEPFKVGLGKNGDANLHCA